MAMHLAGRSLARWLTQIPFSSGDLEPSGRKKKHTISFAAGTVGPAASTIITPQLRENVLTSRERYLELDSGEVKMA